MMRKPHPAGKGAGFTLIEMMIVVAVVAILAMIAYPSYIQHIIRAAREGAQTELVELASLQEKIFLNSAAYCANLTTAYNGTAAGGLGIGSGKSKDGKYGYAVVVAGQTFTLTATPVAGTPQAGDGNLTINSSGARTWGAKTW